MTEHEGNALSSYLPELQYLQKFFLVKTPGTGDLGELLFLTTANYMFYNSLLDV